jgi:hypothetical protein
MGENTQPGVPSTFVDREQFIGQEIAPVLAKYMRWKGLLFVQAHLAEIEQGVEGTLGLVLPTPANPVIEPFCEHRLRPELS